MREIFKPVKGYEGLYEVSDLGRVRTVKTGKIKSPCISNAGYYMVNLHKNGKANLKTVHRIVITAFEGPSKLHTNHKDGDKLNNRLDNLEYVTHRENVLHAYKTRLREPSGRKQVQQLCRFCGALVRTYKSGAAAARYFGVSTAETIMQSANKENRTAYGFKWKKQ